VKEYGFNMYVETNSDVVDMLKVRKEAHITKDMVHGRLLEIIWTVTPGLVLVLIAIPTFSLLYAMDEVIDPSLTIKAIGHQWYWSYEYSDYDEDISFESYMVPTDELEEGDLRLLEVDRKVWIPANTHVRVLVTASDVLHCWAVPAFGVKIDCVPGRLNQVSIFAKREGVFYGQCSELCGVNHCFMPIAVKVVDMELFNNWIDSFLKRGLFSEKPYWELTFAEQEARDAKEGIDRMALALAKDKEEGR
jgi:cytochrome c oxidase subunit 2